jgi:hypothetical protein
MTELISPEWLLRHIAAERTGAVDWGDPVPERGPGIYIVTAAKPVLGQHVVYIGRANRLRRRVRQFYRHRYGDSAPHRGGQEILRLRNPLTVHWVAVADYGAAEHRALEAFRTAIGAWPYGNKIRSARMSEMPK